MTWQLLGTLRLGTIQQMCRGLESILKFYKTFIPWDVTKIEELINLADRNAKSETHMPNGDVTAAKL